MSRSSSFVTELPPGAMRIADFIFPKKDSKWGEPSSQGPACTPSKHETQVVIDAQKGQWIFKAALPGADARILYNEVAMSELYRMFSLRVPPMHVVYDLVEDPNGGVPKYQCVGVVSKRVKNFLTLREFMECMQGTLEEKVKWLSERGLGGISALAHWGAENDFHRNNVGVALESVMNFAVNKNKPSEGAKRKIADGEQVTFYRSVEKGVGWLICYAEKGEYKEHPVNEPEALVLLELLLSKCQNEDVGGKHIAFPGDDYTVLSKVASANGIQTVFNMPVNELEGGVVYVDYDKSRYHIVSTIPGGACDSDRVLSSFRNVSSSQFRLTAHAMRYFPFLGDGDARPRHWLTAKGIAIAQSAYTNDEAEVFSNLDRLFGTELKARDREEKNLFRSDAMRFFLMIALLPRQSIQAAGDLHVPEKEAEFKCRIKNDAISRQNEIECLLVGSDKEVFITSDGRELKIFDDAFHWQYLLSADGFQSMCEQFKAYNDSLSEMLKNTMAIDLDVVEKNYIRLCARMASIYSKKAMTALDGLARSNEVHHNLPVGFVACLEELQSENQRVLQTEQPDLNELRYFNELLVSLLKRVRGLVKDSEASQVGIKSNSFHLSFRSNNSSFFSGVSSDSNRLAWLTTGQRADFSSFQECIHHARKVLGNTLCLSQAAVVDESITHVEEEDDSLSPASAGVSDDSFDVVDAEKDKVSLDVDVVVNDFFCWLMKDYNCRTVREIIDTELQKIESSVGRTMSFVGSFVQSSVGAVTSWMKASTQSSVPVVQESNLEQTIRKLKNVSVEFLREINFSCELNKKIIACQTGVLTQLLITDFKGVLSDDTMTALQVNKNKRVPPELVAQINRELLHYLKQQFRKMFAVESEVKGSFKQAFVSRLLRNFVFVINSQKEMERSNSPELVQYLNHVNICSDANRAIMNEIMEKLIDKVLSVNAPVVRESMSLAM